MPNKSRKSYYELTIYQQQKLESLAKSLNTSPQSILSDIQDILEELANLEDTGQIKAIFTNIRVRWLKEKITEKNKEIEAIKRINETLSAKLKEYEEDYLAIIELGKALETLNKV